MNRRKFRFTKAREVWAAQRQDHQFRGTTLAPNAGVSAAYQADLMRQVREMTKVVERELRTLYAPVMTMDAGPSPSAARILTNALLARFLKHWAALSKPTAKRYMGRVDRTSSAQIGQSIRELSGGLSLRVPPLTGAVKDAFTASVEANVSLIKSIPERYFIDIQGAVLRNVQQGGTGTAGLFEEINRMGQVAERRASLIARDQVSKATTALNDARLRKLGITRFRWIHSGGGKEPRQLHVHMDGQSYSLDDPPVIDEKTGERGLPGQLINCGCRMAPIADFGD